MLFTALICCAPAGAKTDLFEEIMIARASVVRTVAEFRQIVTSHLLTEPQVSHGRMQYSKPDSLILDIESPLPFHVEVRGETMSFQRGKKLHSVNLDGQQGPGIYLRAVRWFLQGNSEQLSARYKLDLSGDLEAWTLELSPSEPGEISMISLVGSSSQVSRIVVDKSAGERILLQLKEINSGS